MYERAVENSKDPWQVNDVSDHFKTEKMCEKAVENKPETLKFVLDNFKSLGICERAVESSKDPLQLNDVPDHFKTKKMR